MNCLFEAHRLQIYNSLLILIPGTGGRTQNQKYKSDAVNHFWWKSREANI